MDNENKIEEQREPSRIFEKETLGAFLRKTRIGNGVDLSRMAQRTHIHADFIQAIERDEYNKLPGVTYNKLFLKSVAKYLELNPDEIFERYRLEHPEYEIKERPSRTNNTALAPEQQEKEETADTEQDANVSKRRAKTFLPVVLLLSAALLIFIMMPTDKGEGLKTHATQEPSEDEFIDADTALGNENEEVTDKMEGTQATLSSSVSGNASVSASNIETETETIRESLNKDDFKLPDIVKRYQDEVDGQVQADFICTKGNISLTVYRNSSTWTNYFSKGHAKKFAADSAIYIRMLGNGEGILMYNGKVVQVKPEPNRFVIRIDTVSHGWVTLKVWNNITGKR